MPTVTLPITSPEWLMLLDILKRGESGLHLDTIEHPDLKLVADGLAAKGLVDIYVFKMTPKEYDISLSRAGRFALDTESVKSPLKIKSRRTRAVRDGELVYNTMDREFIAADGERMALWRVGVPKKGEVILRPTEYHRIYKTEVAQQDFAHKEFKILWRGDS